MPGLVRQPHDDSEDHDGDEAVGQGRVGGSSQRTAAGVIVVGTFEMAKARMPSTGTTYSQIDQSGGAACAQYSAEDRSAA